MSEDATEPAPGPEDTPQATAGPGRPKTYFDQRERDEFLRLLSEGKGRELALVKMGVPYRKFRNTYEEDEDFRDAVRVHQKAALQDLEENGHVKAMAADGAETLLKILERTDRGGELNEARAERARDREFAAEQKALDRAHQLELARLRLAASAKGGPDAAAVDVAVKVAALFAPHIDPAKMPEVAAEFGKLCGGARGGGADGKPAG